MNDHYTYRVTWSPDDGEYAGLCAEFPSLSWLATTAEEAFSGIRVLVHRRPGGHARQSGNPAGAARGPRVQPESRTDGSLFCGARTLIWRYTISIPSTT